MEPSPSRANGSSGAYTVGVQRAWIARHFLIGGDWGPENQEHAHAYQVELQIEGHTLDEHGYLVDIVAVEAILDRMERRYKDQVLNALPEFAGLNPSLENFARILFDEVKASLHRPGGGMLTLKLWETPQAWASFRGEC